MTQDLIHKNFEIRGLVQGVFFRATTRQKAQQLGITGFVQNRPDGSVYAEAEGTPEQLSRFAGFLKRGPTASRVDSVVETAGPLQHYPAFEIK